MKAITMSLRPKSQRFNWLFLVSATTILTATIFLQHQSVLVSSTKLRYFRATRKLVKQQHDDAKYGEKASGGSERPCPRLEDDQFVKIRANSSKMAWCEFTGSMLSHLTSDLFSDRAVRADSYKVVVFFETRLNLALWWAIPWTLFMLGSEWSLQIIAPASHAYFYQQLIQAYSLADCHIDTLEELYGYKHNLSGNFLGHGTYFITQQFFQGLRGELVLIAAGHGVPMRRWDTPEALRFFEQSKQYKHMGAPWSRISVNFFDFLKGPENMTDLVYTYLAGFSSVDEFLATRALLLNVSTSDGKLWRLLDGGNGGFRLLNRSVFVQLSLDIAKRQEELFSVVDLDSELPLIASGTNEDILWGLLLGNLENGAAPKHVLQQFSAELLDSDKPYGIHNYAFHHSIENLARVLQFASQEFFCTNRSVLKLSSDQGEIHENWQNILKRFPEGTEPLECRTTRDITDMVVLP